MGLGHINNFFSVQYGGNAFAEISLTNNRPRFLKVPQFKFKIYLLPSEIPVEMKPPFLFGISW